MHRSIRYALVLSLLSLPAAAQTSEALWQSLMEGNRVGYYNLGSGVVERIR